MAIGDVEVRVVPVIDEQAMKGIVDELVARTRTAIRGEVTEHGAEAALARVEAVLDKIKAGEFGLNPGPGLMVTLVRGAIKGSL